MRLAGWRRVVVLLAPWRGRLRAAASSAGLLACVIGGYLFRHLVSYSRVAGWVLGSLVVFVVVLSFSQYGGLLTERIFGQTGDIDATEASSGRSEIWANLFTTMMRAPITFITGFGWNVYASFPFRFSPHNHYFALWFNLGLVGLIAGCYLLFSAHRPGAPRQPAAEPPLRGQLIAFVIGAIGVCGAVFFVDLHDPWIYFWMYAGVAMRLVLCVEPRPVRRRRAGARVCADASRAIRMAGRRPGRAP